MQRPHLGNYRLFEPIGVGGMGVVHRAEETRTRRAVAIKIAHPEVAFDRRIRRHLRTEAVAAGRVRHRNTVELIDRGLTEDGRPYVVMGLVVGRSLARILSDEPAVPVARAVGLVRQLLDGLGAVHDAGVVHADVKSANLIVDSPPAGDHVTLIDFGIAHLDSTRGDHFVTGTPEYMAPEVIRGEPPRPASDLYGAGVILYELLTGATPFQGETPTAVMARQLTEPTMPPSLRCPQRSIPAALERVLARALAKDPAERFRDAAAFAAALAAIDPGAGGMADVVAPLEAHAWCERATQPWTASGVAAVSGARR